MAHLQVGDADGLQILSCC